jgi:hypothetical protein
LVALDREEAEEVHQAARGVRDRDAHRRDVESREQQPPRPNGGRRTTSTGYIAA